MAQIIKNEYGYPVLIDTWTTEDVSGIADDMGLCLSFDQCVEVLHELAKHYDTEHGITIEGIQLTMEGLFVDLQDTYDEYGVNTKNSFNSKV